MLRRAIALTVFLYPAWLTVSGVALGVVGWAANSWAGLPPGRLEIRPFAIVMSSTPLLELLALHPQGEMLYGGFVLLVLAAFALTIRHYSATLGAILILPAAFILGAQSLNPWSQSLGGAALAAAGMLIGQWLFLTGSSQPYWARVLTAWVPLGATLLLLTHFVMGRRASRIGWIGAAALGVTALLAVWRPLAIPARRPIPVWLLATGLILSLSLPQGLRFAQESLNRHRHQAVLRDLERTPALPPSTPYPKLFFQRGMSIVADRESFGSPGMHQILQQLKGYGVDAIAIVVMGRAPDPEGGMESAAEIELLTRRAHQLGMKVLLKPHHTPRWSRDRDLTTWFKSHEQTMDLYARLASRIHADLLSVGYEMGDAYKNEAEWRNIIARVRSLYPGPLTLSPNHGEQFEGIRFWDALDYVGIDNYIPMPANGSYAEVATYFERVHRQTGKPILFTEAGFASVEGAGREPWAEPNRPLSHEEQIRCYRRMLEAVYHQPWFYGIYWWKVDTDGLGGPQDRTLTPWRKPVMHLIREWFAGPLRR